MTVIGTMRWLWFLQRLFLSNDFNNGQGIYEYDN